MIQTTPQSIDVNSPIEPPTLIDVKNLCSRKLWEILTCQEAQLLSSQQKLTIEAELRERRHYLSELHCWHRSTH